MNPYSDLMAEGMRVLPAIALRRREVPISFEAPVSLCDGALTISRPLRIGAYSYLRTGFLKHVSEIGRYCSIAGNVTIGEGEHPTEWLSTSVAQYENYFRWHAPEARLGPPRWIKRSKANTDAPRGSVVIGNDVWIGGNVVIRRGVKVGDGSIIAAGSIVTKNVPAYAVVGGVPAKVIRPRFSAEIIARLKALRWWEFDIADLAGVQFDQIETAIQQIAELEDSNKIQRRPPHFRTAVLSRKGWCWEAVSETVAPSQT